MTRVVALLAALAVSAPLHAQRPGDEGRGFTIEPLPADWMSPGINVTIRGFEFRQTGTGPVLSEPEVVTTQEQYDAEVRHAEGLAGHDSFLALMWLAEIGQGIGLDERTAVDALRRGIALDAQRMAMRSMYTSDPTFITLLDEMIGYTQRMGFDDSQKYLALVRDDFIHRSIVPGMGYATLSIQYRFSDSGDPANKCPGRLSGSVEFSACLWPLLGVARPLTPEQRKGPWSTRMVGRDLMTPANPSFSPPYASYQAPRQIGYAGGRAVVDDATSGSGRFEIDMIVPSDRLGEKYDWINDCDSDKPVIESAEGSAITGSIGELIARRALAVGFDEMGRVKTEELSIPESHRKIEARYSLTPGCD